MRSPGFQASWRGLAAGLIWLGFGDLAVRAAGQEGVERAAVAARLVPLAVLANPTLPFTELPPKVREAVRGVVEQPTLTARGPYEAFRGQATLYNWLLDHPDRAAAQWRRMGYPCVEITERSSGRHGWTDHAGSDLQWETVYSTPLIRIWYAEGSVRPAPLMPTVPVRAVVVLHHGERRDRGGRTWLHQQADLFIHTDSKTAAAITKLIGPAAPRAAEQCVTQLQTFFSALVRMVERRSIQSETPLPAGNPISPKK